jgi:hypothetical protein
MSTQAQVGSALRAKRAGTGLAVAGLALVVLSFFYGLMAYQRTGAAIAFLMPSTPGLLACAGTSAGLALCFFGLGRVANTRNATAGAGTSSVRTSTFLSKALLIMGIIWTAGAGLYVLTLGSRLLGP